MGTSLEEATNAKTIVRQRLGRPEWLRGIGLGMDAEGYFVKVNVAALTADVERHVPRSVGDVRVELEVVGRLQVDAEIIFDRWFGLPTGPFLVQAKLPEDGDEHPFGQWSLAVQPVTGREPGSASPPLAALVAFVAAEATHEVLRRARTLELFYGGNRIGRACLRRLRPRST